ncbi:MAG: metal-dependent hydrolase [Cyclobacteriaceae bacterium]
MDSVTQFVLGAAVGEAVLGKREGKKALLWGAVGGTIPDLDVLFNFVYSEVDALLMHRGFSHSIVFAMLAAPILGYLISRLYRKSETSWIGWSWLFFWSIFTHPLLDIFTNYGTGLWLPFSDFRVALNTIFVVDPLYTLPLLISCLVLLFLSRKNAWRTKINHLGLLLSSVYLIFTVVNKLQVDSNIESQLSQQKMEYESFMSAPTPFNNVLWSVVVKTDGGFHTGYYSVFDKQPLSLDYLPQQSDLLDDLKSQHEVNQLIKFSKGYFAVRQESDNLVLNDLRFGPLKGWFDPSSEFVFAFGIDQKRGQADIKRLVPTLSPTEADFLRLVDRMWGK